MSDISINGNNYNLESVGKVKVKDVKNTNDVKGDFNDDIVLKDNSGKLKSITADELDISGSWTKPFIGMPSAGSVISFVDDDCNQVEGKVVFSEDENDLVTAAGKKMEEAQKIVAENSKTLVDKTKETYNKAVEYYSNPPKNENTIGESLKKGFEEVKEKINNNETVKEIKKELKQIGKEISNSEPVKEIKKGAEQVKEKLNENETVKEIKKEVKQIGKEINNSAPVQEIKKEVKQIGKEINNSEPVKEIKKGAEEIKDKLNENEAVKEIKKEIKQINKEINNSEPVKEFKKAVNQTIGLATDVIKDVKNQQLTLGQMDTHKEGNIDLSITASKNPTINGSYTFDVKKLDESASIFDENGKFAPQSEILFTSQSVGASVGPSQISANYRYNVGIEFNRPMKNDYSFSTFIGPEVGFRPEGGGFLGIAAGVQGRYQLDDNITLFGGPVVRGTLIGDAGKGKQSGLEAGVNIKF